MSFARSVTTTPRRLAVVATAALAMTSVALIAPSATASAATQPVQVVTSVNGVVNGTTYAGDTTTVSFAVTNRSTTGAKLGAFSIVVPPGLGAVTKGGPGLAGVTAPGNWGETVIPCGTQSNCSAIVLAYASFPLTKSLVGPGGTVTASITFKAPTTAGPLSFPLIGIGNGIFTTPTAPSITVLDGSASILDVVLPATAPKAGVASGITLRSLNASNQVVPFKGGNLTVTLGMDDAGATVNGQTLPPQPTATPPIPAGRTVTLALAPASSGIVPVPVTFTTAGHQSIVVDTGTLKGTSAPFDVAPGDATQLRIDSVADTSGQSTDTKPVQGQTFAVGFSVLDGFGNAAAPSSVTASLSSTNSSVSGGTLAAADVTTSTGTGTFSAVFSRPQTGLNLTVSSLGLASAATTTDVASGATTLTPVGTVGDATAGLPNGSFGPVSFTSGTCTPGVDLGCSTGVEYTLDGVFTNPANGDDHLYSNDAPASITWTCSTGANCVHGPLPKSGSTTAARTLESESGQTYYLYNQGSITNFQEQEQVEDYTWFPIYVALRTGTNTDGTPIYGQFGKALPCSPIVSNPANIITGRIVNADAQAAGYCVDVYAISRVGNTFTGALTLPILFVEDPKMRP